MEKLGFTSLFGVSTSIGSDSEIVNDTMVKSNFYQMCETQAQKYTGNAGRMVIDAIFGKAECEIRQIRREKIEVLVMKKGKLIDKVVGHFMKFDGLTI